MPAVPESAVDGQPEPVAIVGAGLRFPGGNETLAGFDEFLREGRTGIGPVPEDRWDAGAFSSDDPEAKGVIKTIGCGFLDQIDQFDAPFFSVSPLEAQYTDPQQRLLLETAWEALENANINPAALRHGNGGVYIGASSIDYALELDSIPYDELDGHLAAGITTFPMSGRLSYFLGWRGPSLSTDTACASSLTALHLAAEGLRSGQCDIALAGAVSAIHHPKILVVFSHANMLAPDGRCKTFDESADGYVRAEGCGVLVLKRLSDAQRDGDRILALVRGTAIGQDGESAGLTVPNGTAQERVMRSAIANAKLDPADIQYVEAHGTGTALGDPIEMGAISAVFRDSHTLDGPVTVASLKTNVGHMEPVAGIGSVIKTVLQMRAETFYPHLNLVNPSGRIPWDSIPVTVPTECRPWEAPVRRAVVNSFGFAGGIASAVIEEAPATAEVQPEAAGPQVFTVSAKSKRSLKLLVERYQKMLLDDPAVSAADLCYTTNVGRSHFPLRLAGVADGREELAALLGKLAGQADKAAPGKIRKVAFLFTGQGSQYPGMGRALYEQFPVFREHYDACDELFRPHLGKSLLELGEEIHETRFTQPALFALEYALAKLWLSWGARPNVLIGHSIGEVVAAAIAGLFSLQDAVRLVAARARLMQSVTAPGGMAAISAPVAEVEPLLAGYTDLAVAAINSPRQCVVSGGRDSLSAVMKALQDKGLKVTQLAVSHAFHSPLMTEVFEDFRKEIRDIVFTEPSMTLVSNLTGKVARFAELSTPDYWIRHIGEAVNFEAGMRTVDKRGGHVFIEVGPSRALTALARQCVAPEDHRWLSSLDPRDPAGLTVRDALAQYYSAGLPVSWPGFHQGREQRKITLPAYAFDRKRYWLPLKGRRHGLAGSAKSGSVHHPLLGSKIGDGEYSARISADNPGYLADHVIMGKVVFPGTGYLETILALQDAVYGDTRRPVRDARILEPLFLGDETVELRTRLSGSDVEIVSRVEGIERRHFTARLGDRPGDSLTRAGRELKVLGSGLGEPDEVFDAEAAYDVYADAGLAYGPMFRRMRTVDRHGDNLAVGDLRGADVGILEHVSPYLVDAAAHAFAAIGNDGNSYLPVGYDWFRAFKRPKADSLRVLVRRSPSVPEWADIAIDLLAFEGDTAVFELRGLGMKQVASAKRSSLVHELRWIKRSLTGATEERRVLSTRPIEWAIHTPSTADIERELRAGRVTDVCWFWTPGGDLREECERNYKDLLEFLAVLGREGFGRDQRLWLVTQGAQVLPGDISQEPAAAASLWGFGHTLLNEFPAYRATMVDLPADGDTTLLAEEWQVKGGGEFQVAYRDGHRHVRRLSPIAPGAAPSTENEALTIKEYGQFANLRLAPAEDPEPQGDEVTVAVHAAGLNFKDVLNALGMLKEYGEQPLGFEAAGTVVAAGPRATHRVGDEVILNYLGTMRRRINVPSPVAVPKPANVSFTEAAGLAAVYVTAHYALHTLAGIKAGDKVLIHAAAGGVGQAAVQIAQAAGAEVYATASPHKWDLLREQGITHLYNSRTLDFADQLLADTGGGGVDIVLNSLNRDYIPAGIRSLAEGGRFVEMGKVGAWTTEQVREVRPDVAYHNFDLSELPWEDALRVTAEILSTVVAQVGRGELTPIKTTVYGLDEVEEAFGVLSRGANIGKLVLDFSPEPAPRPVRLDPEHTFLITGGLGALGLVTAEKLIAMGARHLELVSRGGKPAADVADLYESLQGKAAITVHSGDIGEPADVARIMAAVKAAGRPLGGIVHSAGILLDAPVTAQTWDTIDAVLRPKVYGTKLLHEASKDFPELQFFLGYSSAAPVVGTPGQANYSAANAYLDNLLVWRAASGQPGLSINWGPWGEVGMSARLSGQLLKRWAEEGIKLTSPAAGMRALGGLLAGHWSQAVVGECDWDRFISAKPISNSLYQKMMPEGGSGTGKGVDLEALTAAPRRDRLALIDEFVRGRVAAVLHFDDPESVDSATEFIRLGLDSLVAVELKNALEAAFRVPLPASVALDYPTSEVLSEYIDTQLVQETADV
ncbi:type I polyketide synthase [Longispora albida]|uniref:type I polyketide synthase n=1 Tax=Longispora albida TaxID=203523 RepID=UPI0003665688|nr:type I polyketide synthase [Longispora albida]